MRLLLLVNLLVAALIGAEIRYPESFVLRMASDLPPASPDTGDVGAGGASGTAPMMPPAERAFSIISERPLFASTRRPVEAPAIAPQISLPQNVPQYIVTGIITAASGNVGILEPAARTAQANTGLVVREGDKVDGWTVKEVNADGVILENEGRVAELKLVDDTVRRLAPPRRRPAAPLRQPANPLRPAQPANQ